MKKVSIRDFQLKPSDYLDKLPIVITQYNKPIAILRPYSALAENKNIKFINADTSIKHKVVSQEEDDVHIGMDFGAESSEEVVIMQNKKLTPVKKGDLLTVDDVKKIEDAEIVDRETTATQISTKPRNAKKKIEVPASKSAAKKMTTPFSICPKHKSMYKSCGCSYE